MPASPTLYGSRDTLGLDAEQARVLERYHTRFVRAGAALEKQAQDRLAAINERLASLGTQFGQNVLADEKSFALVLEEGDLAGLPDFARDGRARRRRGARAARQIRHHPGALLGRDLPAVLRPGATCAKRRSRPGSGAARTAARPTTARLIAEMVALRAERAKLLGFATFADYRLDDQMAKTPAAARKLLDEVWGRARAEGSAPSATPCRR